MERKLIVDVCEFETRVALLEDGQLAEMYVEIQGKERLVGNIYKGRAANILPGMNAAFMDIGLDKNAFLYAGDIAGVLEDQEDIRPAQVLSIQEMLQPNQEILVQVVKQPGGNKGARVTTHITLPGRLVVLMPTVDHVGVSRRISGEENRMRLKELAQKLQPGNMGLILRTAAENATEAEIAAEVTLYSRLWQRILQKGNLVSAPRLVHSEENLLLRTVRDSFTREVDELVLNDRIFYDRVCALVGLLAPEMVKRIKCYEGRIPIFDVYGLEDKMERALQRRVWLKNGCYLVIDETEALTVIDVNTGKYTGKDNLQETILNANLEAADEIARQVRLRDISGIIIVDFIDMEVEENRQLVLARLQEAVGHDRTRTHVLGMTHLGLVEMTRKRMRRRLSALAQSSCPLCSGSGKVPNLDSLTRRVRLAVMRFMETEEEGRFLVEVPKPVAEYILVRNAQGVSILPPYDRTLFFIRAAEGPLSVDHIRLTAITDTKNLSGAQIFH